MNVFTVAPHHDMIFMENALRRFSRRKRPQQGVGLMKIGVISDTHAMTPSKEIEDVCRTHFSSVELILHAGDIVELDVLRAFAGKEVIAVHGNMDFDNVKKSLPDQRILELGGFTFGLTHGWGGPTGIEKRIRAAFGDVDVIVYGHTHRPANHMVGGVLFFNPGAFSGGWSSPRERSVGILTVEESVTGQIIIL